jgi:hypothetical protein
MKTKNIYKLFLIGVLLTIIIFLLFSCKTSKEIAATEPTHRVVIDSLPIDKTGQVKERTIKKTLDKIRPKRNVLTKPVKKEIANIPATDTQNARRIKYKTVIRGNKGSTIILQSKIDSLSNALNNCYKSKEKIIIKEKPIEKIVTKTKNGFNLYFIIALILSVLINLWFCRGIISRKLSSDKSL